MSICFRIAVSPSYAIHIPYGDLGASYDIKIKMRLSPLYFLQLRKFKKNIKGNSPGPPRPQCEYRQQIHGFD